MKSNGLNFPKHFKVLRDGGTSKDIEDTVPLQGTGCWEKEKTISC